MQKPAPQPFQPQAVLEDPCDSVFHLITAAGVLLLLFGPVITGHPQASIVGLGLIVLGNLLED